MDQPGGQAGAPVYRVDDVEVDEVAFLAHVARAVREPQVEVRVGVDTASRLNLPAEAVGATELPVPFVRVLPVQVMTACPSTGAAREIQTETAIALGLPRWRIDSPFQVVDQWALRYSRHALHLVGPQHAMLVHHRFPVPGTWLDAAAAHRRACVVYGPAGLIECPPAAPSPKVTTAPAAVFTDVVEGMAAAGLVRAVPGGA